MKVCLECKVPQPIENFWKDARKPDGKSLRCSSCRKLSLKRSRAKPEVRESCRRYAEKYNLTISNEQHLWYFARARSKRLGVSFDLRVEDIVVPVECPLLGLPLARGKGKLHANSPSLDRIDPNRGYTKENIWVISHRANTIKNNSSLEELRRIVHVLENKLASQSKKA